MHPLTLANRRVSPGWSGLGAEHQDGDVVGYRLALVLEDGQLQAPGGWPAFDSVTSTPPSPGVTSAYTAVKKRSSRLWRSIASLSWVSTALGCCPVAAMARMA